MNEIRFPLLTPEQIEVKVKKCTQKGALLLLYKTARTDMDLLDRVVGPENWDDDYKEIKGNLYCGIAIRTDAGWIRGTAALRAAATETATRRRARQATHSSVQAPAGVSVANCIHPHSYS